MARRALTWKNIDAPDYRGVAAIQARSADYFANALKGGQGLVNTLEQHQTDVETANAEDFKARLLGQYTTPEALQAAQASGDVQALRNRYAANGGLDTGMTDRGAVDTLVREAQTLNTQNQQYADQQQKISERPFQAQFAGLIAEDRNTEALELWKGARDRGDISAATFAAGAATVNTERTADEVTRRNTEAYDQTNTLAEIELAAKNGDWKKVEKLRPSLTAPSALAFQATEQVLKTQQGNKAVANKYIGESQELRKNNQELVASQQDFLKKTGIDVSDPSTIQSEEQLIQAQEFLETQRAKFIAKPENATIYDNMVQDFIAQGATESEAVTRADETLASYITAKAPSTAIQTEQARQRQAILNQYGNNRLVQGLSAEDGPASLIDLFGDSDFKDITGSLSTKQIKSLHKLNSYVQKGVVPAGTFGNKQPWPINRETAKYIINSMVAEKRTLTNWFKNQDVDKALETFYNLEGISPQEVKEFQIVTNQLNDLSKKNNFLQNPGDYVVTQFNNEQLNSIHNRLKPVPAITDETAPRSDAEKALFNAANGNTGETAGDAYLKEKGLDNPAKQEAGKRLTAEQRKTAQLRSDVNKYENLQNSLPDLRAKVERANATASQNSQDVITKRNLNNELSSTLAEIARLEKKHAEASEFLRKLKQ